MTFRPAIALITALSLPLVACSKPDEAALAKSDAAFQGQTVDGEIRAVASRAVMVGQGGRQADACPAVATPASGKLTVHWSNTPGPAKAEVEGEVAVCEADGSWSGIVFPAFGQALDECYTASPVSSPREYQGPCRWGWVETKDLSVVAG
jgi:hypothetical protein